MRAYLMILLLCLLYSMPVKAQKKHSIAMYASSGQPVKAPKKHSIAIGADYVAYTHPSGWNNERIEKRDDFAGEEWWQIHSALWISYYYRNRYSALIYASYLNQTAQYKIPEQTPGVFLSSRAADFYDFLIGYNFSPFIMHNLPRAYREPVDIWLYGGVSYVGKYAETLYTFYNPVARNWATGGFGAIDIDHSNRYYNKIKPTIHLQIKYNPIRFIVLGIGGTCHFVGKGFNPVSGNISLGFQL